MRRSTSHKLKKIILACLANILLIVIGLLSNTIGTDLRNWLDNNKINAPATYILILVFVILTIIVLTWNILSEHGEEDIKVVAENIEPDVKKFFDSLKERYDKRYRSKLDGRFEITLEVSEQWNRDKPKTYKFGAEAKISNAIDAVRKAFDEKGRLLIVGSPGSGKTVLLLKLALELLGDECKAEQKLPVIFNLASWSEEYPKFDDWLIDVLKAGNGLSKDFARTLLQENRISFLLDGLDELARNEDTKTANIKRAKCLNSIYGYAQVRHKFVICCRREEFAQIQKSTNQDELLPAKVEVLDLTKLDIEVALAEAQKEGGENRASAEHLEKIIRTNEVFLDALSTPFYFTTALEVFDKSLIREKDFPNEIGEIKKYLLDKFIKTKIYHTRNLIKFEKDTAKINQWLKWLAQLMEKKQLVTFELANLQVSELTHKKNPRLIIGLVVGFFLSLWLALWSGLFWSLFWGIRNVSQCISLSIKYGFAKHIIKICYPAFFLGFELEFFDAFLRRLVVGFLFIFMAAFSWGVKIIDTSAEYLDTSDFLRVRNEAFRFFTSVSWLIWFPTNLILGFLLSFRSGLRTGLIVGLMIALSFSFMTFYGGGLSGLKESNRVKYIQHSYQRINNGIFLSVILLSLTFFVLICLGLIIVNIELGFGDLIDTLVFFILLSAIFFEKRIIIRLYDHIILRFCLYREGVMPLKYATFLDYAAEARILEKDGGQWRFRHQNLQEYFANLDE